ncbi:MAG: glycosyltransferase [Nitrospirae bacterium]|nr:MAG: glycosyltransferase [Nitrospirota bacterium]
MLPEVHVGRRSALISCQIDHYRLIVGDELIDEIFGLAHKLKGLKVCEINSTAFGGGVAELLPRLVPFMEALGLDVDWRLIHAPTEFFTITKAFHNALQGKPHTLLESEKSLYLQVNEQTAKLLEERYDVIIVHDPQPAALRYFAGQRDAKWIWRCHIDSSHPSEEVSQFLLPYLNLYDAMIFTMPEFLIPGMTVKRIVFIPPAIDPLATKNMDLPLDICKRAMADSGVDPTRPVLLQVSRFDPWKDPLGVIKAYQLVKQECREVQLVFIGAMAADDPEGWALMDQVEEEAAKDPDIFVFNNLAGIGNAEVNMFQRGSDVIVQKSIREGFGLVVSEAFWKEKPVVAGNAGGIPLQFPDAFRWYLVENIEDCAERILHLLRKPGARGAFGRAGRERVRQHFLLPRLVRDRLRLIRDLVDGREPQRSS